MPIMLLSTSAALADKVQAFQLGTDDYRTLFAAHPGRVYTYEQIYEQLWPNETIDNRNDFELYDDRFTGRENLDSKIDIYIMIHEGKDGVFVYLYTSIDAVFCSNDDYYEDVADAREDWDSEIDARGWLQIDDPLPYCQHDSVLPIRVKDRNTGNPQWEQLEILVEGEWVEYHMKL